MKKPFILVFVLLLMKLGYSGNHYTYTVTSGTPIITAASVPAGLKHGDTLDIPANAWYASLGVSNLNGIAGDSIVIRFLPGSLISNNVGWASGEWVNASFIKVIGLNSHNNGSPVVALRAGCHSLRFTECNFINDAGLFSNQAAFVADDKNGTTMYFSGAKSQTFYDVHIDKSNFNGFVDAEVISVGTGSLRSISLDFEIDHNSIKNITQDMALVPYAMNLSGYNFKIHDNILDSIVYNATACRCAHNSTITLYGNGDIYNNKFSHSYANDMRIVPMKFVGLPGYTGPISVFNNISLWHTSYSMVETSPNNGVGRVNGNGGYMAFTDTRIYYNTVYHTSRASYNGDYSGMVADVYPQQGGVAPVFVHNNVIIEPEQDRPWDPSRGYVIYFGGGPTPIDSGGNKVFQTLAQSGITDVQTWMPSAVSPLLKAADASNPTVASDIYGDTRPQTIAKTVGAVEALATAVPVNQPPVASAGTDISIVLPVNTASLNGSGSKDADGSISSYSWSMISGPSTASIANATTVTAAVSGLVKGVYAFRLSVTDNSGATAADTMQVSVAAAAAAINQPPVASAGTDISIVLPVNTASLNGSGSKDADGSISSYSWSVISGPSTATITNGNTANASVSGLVQGVYAFRLSVLDNSGATAADTMQVSVAAAAAAINQPPVANAGADAGIVLPVNTVALSGSNSKDADGTISSYNWSMISGPSTATITNANTVTAAASGLLAGVYAFRLLVTDNSGATAADTVQVTVVAAAVPTAPVVGGTGLHADYYTTNNLTGPIALSRTDTTVNFDWGYGAPASTVYVTDNFSIRWAGQVLAPYSETYTFYTNSDDGVRLWVNGQQIINNWTDHAATENSGTIKLVAGQKYNIVMEYYEKGAAAVAKLSWSSPSAAKAIIPKRYLYPTVVATAVATGNGTGLKGEYYTTNNLSGAIALTRTDSTVNFDWGYGAPASTVYVTDNFSVRWSGQVQAVYSETYTFYTNSDDGVRLWVNGQQIINNWTDHALTENSGTITLVAGQKYSIVMEYYEKGYMAVSKLSWSSASTPKAIVPKSQLYPAAASSARMVTDEEVAIPAFAGKEGLAPNPVTAGQASRLSFNSAGGTASVQVIDASGRIAFVQQVNAAEGANSIMIPTTGLRIGMYVVRVVQAGKATSYKLLVQ